jgi:DNA-binding NarL/FixJ family response regulator
MVLAGEFMNLISNAGLTPQPWSESPTVALPSLLIADDDPVVRSVLTAQLGSQFEIVAVAADAQEAIDLVNCHHPDVALIDVMMPAGGGLRAVAEIHQHSPDTTLAAFSGDESERGVSDMLSAGAIAYIRKGVSAQELAQKLVLCMEADGHVDG